MGRPYPLALRERVVALVEERNTHRSVAAHFRVINGAPLMHVNMHCRAVDEPRSVQHICRNPAALTLKRGDVVILDNHSSHKGAYAAAVLQSIGAWFLFLPPYGPDLNPIEMAFSKLKALIRKAAARSYDDLWKAVGNVCNLFSGEECFNFSTQQDKKSIRLVTL